MLFVKTKLAYSMIAGIGLFADQKIKKGDIIWEYHPLIDILLTKEQIEKLSSEGKRQFLRYAYLDLKHQKYLLCGDDSRFFNHSEKPNCIDKIESDFTIAAKDIEPGEEMTCNYKDFYGDIDGHPEIG